MDDSAMILRVKFMTTPGERWVPRKRLFAERRELFEREGIELAHREVTVRIPGPGGKKKLSEERVRAIGEAARSIGGVGDPVEKREAGFTFQLRHRGWRRTPRRVFGSRGTCAASS